MCGGLRRSDRIFSGGRPTSGSNLSARSGGCLPSWVVVWLFTCRLGSRLNPFRGSEWPLNLSGFQQLRWRWAVSLDLFVTTLFHRGLPYFSLFHDPNALRTEVLQPWNWWQAYAFPPYTLLYASLLNAPLVLWGPQCSWFSGASGSGSRRFGGSASGQGSVEQASGSVTTSRSVRACSSYLVSIQRFISSRGFSRRVA